VTSAPFGHAMVSPSIKAFLKKPGSLRGANTGPFSGYSENSISPRNPSSNHENSSSRVPTCRGAAIHLLLPSPIPHGLPRRYAPRNDGITIIAEVRYPDHIIQVPNGAPERIDLPVSDRYINRMTKILTMEYR
jgi:hypothetical protein